MRSRLAFAAVLVAAFLAPAQAAVPERVSLSARMVDTAGQPVSGSHDVVFRLFDVELGGAAVWTESRPALVFTSDGLFSVELGTAVRLTPTVLDGGRLFLELTIDGTTMAPRIPVVSVPYAVRATLADEAGRLGALTANDVQRRVGGTCPTGEAIRVVNADGTVSCEASGRAYTAGTGLTLSGSTFSVNPAAVQSRVTGTCATAIIGLEADGGVLCSSDLVTTVNGGGGVTASRTGATVTLGVDPDTLQHRVSGACTAGQAIRAISNTGTVTCEADDNTTYGTTANGGLALSSGNFGLTACTAGQVLKAGATSGTWACGADVDTNTTYSALANGGVTINASNQVSVDATVARKDAASGNQAFDTDTLYLDYTNDRVGVNTNAPGTALDVVGTARATGFQLRATRTGAYNIPGSAFVPDGNSATAWSTTSSYGNLVGASVVGITLKAPVNLPDGATITLMYCLRYDNDASNDFISSWGYVYRRGLTSLTEDLLGGVGLTTTGASTSVQALGVNVSTDNVINNLNYQYYVSVALYASPAATTDLRFYGCQVRYAYDEIQF